MLENTLWRTQSHAPWMDRVMAAVLTTSGGAAADNTEVPGALDTYRHATDVLDALGPPYFVDSTSVTYPKESTFTNVTTEIVEGAKIQGTKVGARNAALAVTQTVVPVRKIATVMTATAEVLEDAAAVPSYIERRLGYMLRRELAKQVLDGDNQAPNLHGIAPQVPTGNRTLYRSTSVKTRFATGIANAVTQIRKNGFAEPTHIVMSTDLFRDSALLKSNVAAIPIAWPGSPSGGAVFAGLPVVFSPDMTQDVDDDEVAVIVGDFANHVTLAMRRRVTIEYGWDTDSFAKDSVMIRASVRAALLVLRPAAFAIIKANPAAST